MSMSAKEDWGHHFWRPCPPGSELQRGDYELNQHDNRQVKFETNMTIATRTSTPAGFKSKFSHLGLPLLCPMTLDGRAWGVRPGGGVFVFDPGTKVPPTARRDF